MPTVQEIQELANIRQDIEILKRYWYQRNLKFQDWYEMLILVDTLKSKGMETYVSNEPMTFYNMAHYLLTKGRLSHSAPIESESAFELDKRAKIHRSCEYMWNVIDRMRQSGGNAPFIDDISFFMLVLGWTSTVFAFDENTGELRTNVWNPYDTFPRFANGRLSACVHSYKITETEAYEKALANHWEYAGRQYSAMNDVVLDDYYREIGGELYNMIFIDGRPVTSWVHRPNMKLVVSPIGGFPDRGSLVKTRATTASSTTNSYSTYRDWRRLAGRGIFEVNEGVTEHFNKWKSMISQILRDTAQPITQEFSANAQATPEQLRERGALFHYAPGEAGLQRVPPPAIPLEVQANLIELRREMQKGSFNDVVYGMMDGKRGQTGYALSLMASSSANQILYPYMDGKHFVVSEGDRFWLSKLKTSRRTFQVKGRFIESLKPTDIPENVSIIVESDVATPKDWLERSTVANMLKEHLDDATIVTEVLKIQDPQGVQRRRNMDAVLNSTEAQLAEKITGFYSHADYLEKRQDFRQANIFRRLAQAMEAQIGVPPPGQGSPTESTRIEEARKEGAPPSRTRVAPEVSPPEARGFPPQQLRETLGRGTLRGA